MMSGDWETEVYGASPLSSLERVDMGKIFTWIETHLPINGSRIDWAAAQGEHSHCRFVDEVELVHAATRAVVRRIDADSGVEHVGDGVSPFGTRFTGEGADLIMRELLGIPEHHYFLDEHRSWLVVVSNEGNLDVLDRAT
ncbi:hypothetical protein [Promicromonospora sukumoe]|uniref:hypothetical protein n=1 Tax=Promicromonospora sukumoe TaxID=88382 RepID=UPI00365B0DAE